MGPYQGPLIACGQIAFGKGVCGAAAAQRCTQVVDDVTKIENYIACDEETRSEIVVPVTHPVTGDLHSVLDIDSASVAAFDEVDRACLERIVQEFVFQPSTMAAASQAPPAKRKATDSSAGAASA